MKPYNERLPLIDAAIMKLVDFDNKSVWALMKEDEHLWLCEGKYQRLDDPERYRGVYVGTRAEFNQRKAELRKLYEWGAYVEKYTFEQFLADKHLIEFCKQCAEQQGFDWQDTLEKRPEPKEQPMKYEYGVEYETNGEKPDLPDDVVIKYKNKAGAREWEGKVGQLAFTTDFNLNPVTSFRIVDERYKPKEQEMSNDWYEKGELPPERIKCEFDKGDKWATAYTIGLDEYGCMVVDVQGEHPYQSSPNPIHFRPLHTETDTRVSKALKDMGYYGDDDRLPCATTYEVTTSLIEAGYRKIKPMSETEFVFAAINFGISGQGAKHLFNQGCRFLDGGNDAS